MQVEGVEHRGRIPPQCLSMTADPVPGASELTHRRKAFIHSPTRVAIHEGFPDSPLDATSHTATRDLWWRQTLAQDSQTQPCTGIQKERELPALEPQAVQLPGENRLAPSPCALPQGTASSLPVFATTAQKQDEGHPPDRCTAPRMPLWPELQSVQGKDGGAGEAHSWHRCLSPGVGGCRDRPEGWAPRQCRGLQVGGGG